MVSVSFALKGAPAGLCNNFEIASLEGARSVTFLATASVDRREGNVSTSEARLERSGVEVKRVARLGDWAEAIAIRGARGKSLRRISREAERRPASTIWSFG